MPDILADRTPDEALRAARDAVRAAAAEIEAATKAAAESAVAGIRAAAGKFGAQALFDESAYMRWITGEIETISQELQPILFSQLRKQLRTGADPKAIATARALADRQSKRIAGDMASTELKKIGTVIADGIAGGQNPLAVARRLDAVKGLDKNRVASYEKAKEYFEGLDISTKVADQRLEAFRQKLLRSRKETIARTEMRMATSGAKLQKAKDSDAQWKAWSTAGDADVDEDDCAPNEAQSWIPINDAFISGHDTTPAHPNCRCNVVTKTQPPTAADKARRETKAAQTEQASKRGKNEKSAEKVKAKAEKKVAKSSLEDAKAKPKSKQSLIDDVVSSQKNISRERAAMKAAKPGTEEFKAAKKAFDDAGKEFLAAKNALISDAGSGISKLTPEKIADGKKLGFSDREFKGLRDYTADSYVTLNKALREQDFLGGGERARFLKGSLDSTLEKLPKFKGVTERQMTFQTQADLSNFLKGYQKGGSVDYREFLSTSGAPGKNFAAGKFDARLVINGKNGRDISRWSTFEEEKEILFPRGSKFKVTGVSEESGKTIIFMEEV